MELYKRRTFGEYFQDTFEFVRQNGKHFFKNYFIVNGVFILIIMSFMYLILQFYKDILMSSFNQDLDVNLVENYLNENGGLFILLFFAFLIVAMIAGVINYAYTPIYLNLYEKYKGNNFSTKIIFNALKKHLTKLFIFLLASMLISIPVMIIAVIAMFVLAITIIGIPLLFLVMGWLYFFYNAALIEYLNGEKGKKQMATSIASAILNYKKTLSENIGNDISFETDYTTIIEENTEYEFKDVTFKVQIAAGSTLLEPKSYNFKGLSPISREKYNNLYRYFYGETSNYKIVEQLQKEAVEKGYKTAFITAYKNNKRVDVNSVLKSNAN